MQRKLDTSTQKRQGFAFLSHDFFRFPSGEMLLQSTVRCGNPVF